MTRPGRAGVLAAAVTVALALPACAGEPPAPGVATPGSARTEQHWVRPVARVDVDEPLGPGGGVDVVPGPPGRLDVTLDLSWRGARPVVGEDWGVAGPARIDPAGDVRRTAVGCPAPAPPSPDPGCAARYRLALPADADLGARTTHDPVSVRGLRGDTALTTTTGPITMAELAGTVRATSERGRVVATALAAETVFVVAGGPVDLGLVVAPREVRVDGGAGPVVLALPGGTSYDLDTGVRPPGSRPARVEVATDPSSPHEIRVQAGGDVLVRYAP